MKTIRELWVAVFLVLGMVSLASAQQNTTTSTTLSAAVANDETDTITVTSATGFTANTTTAYVDNEAMNVISVSGTTIKVQRGSASTAGAPHTSGEVVWVGPKGLGPFVQYKKHGSCTSANEVYLPIIHVSTGDVGRCTNSEWDWELRGFGRILSKLDLPLNIATTSDGRTITFNSRNYTQTSGSSIGFQAKPAQAATTTGSVIGAEISPRINNTFTTANIIGLHVDAYVRGTTARTISGDVRGQQIELVTDDAATNTVSGNVIGLRFRAAFSATTITGQMVPIQIEAAETQTNSQQWDAIMRFTGTATGIWGTDTGSGDTESGFLKVLIDGNTHYIVLYSDAP